MESNTKIWIETLRQSHNNNSELVRSLSVDDLNRQSACTEWTVSQVMSHIGSQAEIFGLMLEAGLNGKDAPSNEAFPPIWDRWNAMSPQEQASSSIAANEALLQSLEAVDEKRWSAFHLSAFGRELDPPGFLRMKLNEHAIHSWDIAIVFDPDAKILPGAVDLTIDSVAQTASRLGKPSSQQADVHVTTRQPVREFALVTNGVAVEPWTDRPTAGSMELPSELLIRLIYGRFRDKDITEVAVDGAAISLDQIRVLFPGR